MTTCTSCGARLSPTDLACPFCKTITPAGQARHAEEERARHAQASSAAHQEHNEKILAGLALARSAKHALIWSLVGIPLCCLVMPSIVATVLALRARSAARAQGVAMPGQAQIALALSGLSILAFVAFAIFGVTDALRVRREKEALRGAIEAHVAAPTLEHDTACALTHLYLLEDKLVGVSGNLVQEFECSGKLTQQGERASLDDVRFRASSTTPHRSVTACMKRGARWLVDEVRADGKCGAAEAPERFHSKKDAGR